MLEEYPQILSIGEVAKLLNVTVTTLRRWDQKGLLKAFRPTERSKRRYQKKDIEAFINKRPRTSKK